MCCMLASENLAGQSATPASAMQQVHVMTNADP